MSREWWAWTPMVFLALVSVLFIKITYITAVLIMLAIPILGVFSLTVGIILVARKSKRKTLKIINLILGVLAILFSILTGINGGLSVASR